MQAEVSINTKLSKSCRRILQLIKVSFRRLFFASNPSRFRNLRCVAPENRKSPKKKKKKKRRRIRCFIAPFRSLRGKKFEETNYVEEPRSTTENMGESNAIFPSPVTRAYVNRGGFQPTEAAAISEDAQEACRSFEKYLLEMIVEEGKVRELMDVEELLYCLNKLKSPVFIEMVCRFYGELCRDMFSDVR